MSGVCQLFLEIENLAVTLSEGLCESAKLLGVDVIDYSKLSQFGLVGLQGMVQSLDLVLSLSDLRL